MTARGDEQAVACGRRAARSRSAQGLVRATAATGNVTEVAAAAAHTEFSLADRVAGATVVRAIAIGAVCHSVAHRAVHAVECRLYISLRIGREWTM